MSDVNRQVVEGLEAALLLVDAGGEVLFVNERAAALFGRDLTGVRLEPDSLADDIPLVELVARICSRTGGSGRELLASTDETGSHFYWVTVSPVGGGGGGAGGDGGGAAPGRRLVAVVDISAPLMEAPAIRKVFSQVNHDLRSPLTSIAGAAELLLSGRVGALEPIQRRLVTIVDEGTRKMGELLTKTKSELVRAEAAGQSRE